MKSNFLLNSNITSAKIFERLERNPDTHLARIVFWLIFVSSLASFKYSSILIRSMKSLFKVFNSAGLENEMKNGCEHTDFLEQKAF